MLLTPEEIAARKGTSSRRSAWRGRANHWQINVVNPAAVSRARKMFCRRVAVFLNAAHKRGNKLGDVGGIFAKRSRIDDQVEGLLFTSMSGA
jgi:hypothetical protein